MASRFKIDKLGPGHALKNPPRAVEDREVNIIETQTLTLRQALEGASLGLINAAEFELFKAGSVDVVLPKTNEAGFHFSRLSQELNRVRQAQQLVGAQADARILQPVTVTGLITPRMLRGVQQALLWARRRAGPSVTAGTSSFRGIANILALAAVADEVANHLAIRTSQIAGVPPAQVTSLPTLEEIQQRIGAKPFGPSVPPGFDEDDLVDPSTPPKKKTNLLVVGGLVVGGLFTARWLTRRFA
jgi:hypothetical protein